MPYDVPRVYLAANSKDTADGSTILPPIDDDDDDNTAAAMNRLVMEQIRSVGAHGDRERLTLSFTYRICSENDYETYLALTSVLFVVE